MVTRLVLGLINFFLGLAEIFLGLRVLMRFFAANPTAPFVHWIYTSSDALLQPFRGIFPVSVIGKYHVIDFPAIFAMIVYGLLALLFEALVGYVAPTRTTVVEKK